MQIFPRIGWRPEEIRRQMEVWCHQKEVINEANDEPEMHSHVKSTLAHAMKRSHNTMTHDNGLPGQYLSEGAVYY